MRRGDRDRTTRTPDGSIPLIFPLQVEPTHRRRWLETAIAGGLILAVAGAVAAATSQLDRDPGKRAIVASGPDKSLGQVNDGQLSVFELEPGMCLRELADDTDAQDVAVVACDERHAAEVVASLRMPDGPWPGGAAVEDYASDRCVAAIQRAGVDANLNLSWTYFGPTESSWTLRDDRVVSCLVVSPNEPLTESMISAPDVRLSGENWVAAESMERQ